MFFSILGFVALFVLVVYGWIFSGLVWMNVGGQYNIGGVPNTLKDKFLALLFTIFMGGVTYLLFKNAPFTISFLPN